MYVNYRRRKGHWKLLEGVIDLPEEFGVRYRAGENGGGRDGNDVYMIYEAKDDFWGFLDASCVKPRYPSAPDDGQ